MKYGLRHFRVVAEDDRVRVLDYAPQPGDMAPIHSHSASVVHVLKGGRVRYTMANGTSSVVVLTAGRTMLRPEVTHPD